MIPEFLGVEGAHAVRESVLCTACLVWSLNRGETGTSSVRRDREGLTAFQGRLKGYARDYCVGKRGSNIPGWALIAMSQADRLEVQSLSKWLVV